MPLYHQKYLPIICFKVAVTTYTQLDIFRRISVWNLTHWCSGGHLPSIFLLFVKAREAWLALKQLARRSLAHVTR